MDPNEDPAKRYGDLIEAAMLAEHHGDLEERDRLLAEADAVYAELE